MLGPGGPAGFAHQLLKAALAAVAGGEAGPRRGGAKAGGVGDLLVEHVGVDATGEQKGAALAVLAQQLRNLKAPTLPPVMQQPHHELLHLGRAGLTQWLDFVLQTAQQGGQQSVDGLGIDTCGQRSGLLHRRAQAGAVAEFSGHLPAQAITHQAQQGAVCIQAGLVLLLQGIPFAQPFEVVWDEGGGKVHRVGEALLPVADQALLQLIQSHWPGMLQLGLLHGGGEGGAEGGAVGAGGNEAGAVGSVLHRIAEGQQLLVAVEGRRKQGGAPGAGEVGGRQTDQQQALLGAALRAIAADVGMVVVVLIAAIGDVNGQQVAALAVGADPSGTILRRVKGEAVAAEAIGGAAGSGGEEVTQLRGAGEEGLVEALQIAAAIEAVAALADHGGGPGGGTAMAAVHHR